MTPELLHIPAFDRRSLLRGLGLGALAVAGLTGCSSAVGEQRAAAGAAAANPVRGGTLALAARTDLVPGNFFTNTVDGVTVTIGLVYDTLIRYPNDRVEPQPRLATSWELAPDGRSLTLQLRDDVFFHGRDGARGRPFTSADAEFSLRTYADPRWTPQLRSTAAAITSYDTSDPHRIVLGFAHPLSNVFDLLDTVPIVDSETLDQLGRGEAFIGTGPFRFESWTPNTSITYVRNEHYRDPGRPYLDRVELTIASDAQALLAGIRSGRYDVVNGLPFRDVATLDATDGYHAVTLTGAELQTYVGANVTAPGLSDVRVRQAIAYTVDRQRVVDEVLRGSGYVANLPWPRYSPAFDESRNATYGRDLDRARALLTQAPPVPAVPLTFQAKHPVHEPVAQIVQSNLAEVGVTATLQPVEAAQFTKQLIGAQFPGLWTTYHSWAQYTPSTLTVSAYPFNAQKNASNFVSPAYRQAAETAWKLPGTDTAGLDRAYDALSAQLLENLFLIELGVVLNQYVAADRAQGVAWSKRSEIDLTDAFKAG
jgi:peptide/nickel transport system substrate-binding protein